VALGSWRVGILAAWLLAIPSINVTLYTTSSLGGYGEMLLIGNLILLAGFRIANDFKGEDFRLNGLNWVWLGFLSGLGLWTFGLTLVYYIPVLVFLSWSIWRRMLNGKKQKNLFVLASPLCYLLLGSIAGAFPWVIYALKNGFVTLLSELTGSAIAGVESTNLLGQLIRHTFNFVLFGGTVIAGLRPPWGIEWLAQPLLPFVLAFWLGVLVFILVQLYKATYTPMLVKTTGESGVELNRNRSIVSDLVFCRLGIVPSHNSYKDIPEHTLQNPDGLFLLAGVGLTLAVGFIFTPFGADPSGRYFVPLAVILALFAALAIIKLQAIYGAWVWGLVVLVMGFNLWGTMQAANRYPPGLTTQFDSETRIDHRYDIELINFLDEQGETRGYTTYWISYPLAFQSAEHLIFVPQLPYHSDLRYTPRDDRYAPYTNLVNASSKVAYITGDQPALENRLREGLAALEIAWQEKVIGDYRVFYQLSKVVQPDELGLGGQMD
jgi:hypothetical protein